MQKTEKTVDTMHCTEFTDIANNVKVVKHSVVLNEYTRKETEEQIIDELYRVFAHKVN